MIRILLFFCLFILLSSESNAQKSIDNRHLIALVYVKYNPEVAGKLRKAFPHLVNKKDKCIDFMINDQVEFIPIYFFSSDLQKDDVPIDPEILGNRGNYRDLYTFTSYKIEELNSFIPESNSKIRLTLSQPVHNYLIIEFLDSEANIGPYKMGRSLQVLFLFDEDGGISKVLYASPIYN